MTYKNLRRIEYRLSWLVQEHPLYFVHPEIAMIDYFVHTRQRLNYNLRQEWYSGRFEHDYDDDAYEGIK